MVNEKVFDAVIDVCSLMEVQRTISTILDRADLPGDVSHSLQHAMDKVQMAITGYTDQGVVDDTKTPPPTLARDILERMQSIKW